MMQLLVLFLDSQQPLLLVVRFNVDGLQGVAGVGVVGFGDVVGQRCLAVVVGVVVCMVVCCIVGMAGVVRMGPVVVVLMSASELLSLLGVLHGLAFEGIEFEMVYIFLQLVVLLFQLLHQFVVLLNFPAFLLQPIDSFKRTKLLQMLTVQFILQLLHLIPLPLLPLLPLLLPLPHLLLQLLVLLAQILLMLFQLTVFVLIALRGLLPLEQLLVVG